MWQSSSTLLVAKVEINMCYIGGEGLDFPHLYDIQLHCLKLPKLLTWQILQLKYTIGEPTCPQWETARPHPEIHQFSVGVGGAKKLLNP